MKRHLDLRVPGAVALLLAAAGLAWHGQPDIAQKWDLLAPEFTRQLTEREVYIDPGELLQLMNNDYIDLLIFDVRNESDWNQFHLVDAEHVTLAELPAQRDRLLSLPENAVLVVVSNDEMLATEAWQHLMVIARPNAYILAGGLNLWLNIYGVPEEEVAGHGKANLARPDGTLRHRFTLSLGNRHAAARPDEHRTAPRAYTAKVKLLKKIVKAGGCS